MTGTMILEPGRSYQWTGPVLFRFVFTRWAGIALAVGVVAGLAFPAKAPTSGAPGRPAAFALSTSSTPETTRGPSGRNALPDGTSDHTVEPITPTVARPATTTYGQARADDPAAQAREACAVQVQTSRTLDLQKRRAHAAIDSLYDANGDPAGTADQFAHASDVFAEVNSRWLNAVSAVGACYENHGAETGDAPVNIQP